MEMEMEPSSAETSTAVEDDLSDLFGDQEVFPRVGDEYQAEILEGIQQSKAETTPIEFFVGLPVTVMRVEKDKPSSTKGETGRNGFCIVPGSKQEDWSETEEAELVLGLYIFGKDFVKLKAFLGCKTMGSIMAFYYGKFYKSHGYRRWSDCKKSKSRKVALGQKIFAGFRLQELLSRLSLHASEERQNALSKVSDLYEEGNMRLDEFVLTIKAIVGMNNFVEAMSIGKGKQDITTLVSPKTNHSTVRESCSSLTPSEIIKLLTGDVRLSKARSNDLFWEAVWPRLLARSWHSEQPKCYAAVSKQSLVFLLPGFAKFSRRSLIKGDHYFDSITDILNKVATEPTLLDLVVDESSESKKKLEPDNSSDCQLQSYLQPRTSYRNSDLLKFTIADTSLTTIEGKPYSTRKLRILPDESIVISASIHNSREDANTSTDDDLNHCFNSASVATNKHKRKRVSQKEVQQSTSTDDDTNDCSNGTSVATNKHKRKRVSQKEVQQPISTNGNLVEDSGFGFSMDQSNHESISRGLIDQWINTKVRINFYNVITDAVPISTVGLMKEDPEDKEVEELPLVRRTRRLSDPKVVDSPPETDEAAATGTQDGGQFQTPPRASQALTVFTPVTATKDVQIAEETVPVIDGMKFEEEDFTEDDFLKFVETFQRISDTEAHTDRNEEKNTADLPTKTATAAADHPATTTADIPVTTIVDLPATTTVETIATSIADLPIEIAEFLKATDADAEEACADQEIAVDEEEEDMTITVEGPTIAIAADIEEVEVPTAAETATEEADMTVTAVVPATATTVGAADSSSSWEEEEPKSTPIKKQTVDLIVAEIEERVKEVLATYDNWVQKRNQLRILHLSNKNIVAQEDYILRWANTEKVATALLRRGYIADRCRELYLNNLLKHREDSYSLADDPTGVEFRTNVELEANLALYRQRITKERNRTA